MNNPITRAVDSAVGAVGDFTSDLAGKAANVRDSISRTADKALDYAVSVRELKRNPPSQVTIADLFHRKLYDFADFDFLIEYLRSHGIATCKNIYTINSLAKEVVPSLTEEALKDRDVRKVNATYAGIMRLCRRHRKGMLAYLSVEGHAQVCLIKSWDRFLQLAGFNNATTADKLMFNTEDVFPRLRINKSLNARIAKYNEQALEERRAQAAARRENSLLTQAGLKKDAQPTGYKSLDDLADSEIAPISDRSTTALFRAGQDIDFAQMLAMNFAKIKAGDSNLEWDEYNSADYFLYYLFTKVYPDYAAIRSVKDFLSYVTDMFRSVGFTLDVKVLQQLSGNRMKDLKNALSLTTVEEKAEVNDLFDKAMMSLAVSSLVFEVNTNATYQEIYENEITRIQNKRQQLATQIKNMTSLIRVPTDAELAEYTRYVPDFMNLVNTRNAEIFKGMWGAAISGKLIDLTVDGFDKIACLLVYDKKKKTNTNLSEFDNDFITTINELLSEANINWTALLQTTSGDILKACRIVRNVKQSTNENNAYAKRLLCMALSKFYGFRIGEDEMWQQIYIGICNAKKSVPRSGLTVASAAEELGIIESQEEKQSDDTASSVAADLEDMEL